MSSLFVFGARPQVRGTLISIFRLELKALFIGGELLLLHLSSSKEHFSNIFCTRINYVYD